MDDYHHNKRSKSGQIPAFGEWDYAHEQPITQYFECARQAGLIRFSSSCGETADQAWPRPHLYAPVHHHHHHLNNNNPLRKARGGGGGGGREKRVPRAHIMEQKKQQAKVCDVTQPPANKHHQYHEQPNRTHEDKDKDKDGTVSRPRRLPTTTTTTRPPKPVDEDLYKIPPELLHTTKRKKMLRFVSCLVPACAS